MYFFEMLKTILCLNENNLKSHECVGKKRFQKNIDRKRKISQKQFITQTTTISKSTKIPPILSFFVKIIFCKVQFKFKYVKLLCNCLKELKLCPEGWPKDVQTCGVAMAMAIFLTPVFSQFNLPSTPIQTHARKFKKRTTDCRLLAKSFIHGRTGALRYFTTAKPNAQPRNPQNCDNIKNV